MLSKMGSLHSAPSTTSFSSTDGTNSSGTSLKIKKSRRIMGKFLRQSSSRTDMIDESRENNLDIMIQNLSAQDPDKGENQEDQTADMGECKQKKEIEKEVSNNFFHGHSLLFFFFNLNTLDSAKNNNSATNTDAYQKPVSNEDRRTHTNSEHDVETESTKHNADKVSCSSTATIARSLQKESTLTSSDKGDSFENENYRVLVDTESWNTAKNWKSDSKSSSIRTDQGNYSHGLPSLMFYIRRVQFFNVLRARFKNLFLVAFEMLFCGSLPRLLLFSCVCLCYIIRATRAVQYSIKYGNEKVKTDFISDYARLEAFARRKIVM